MTSINDLCFVFAFWLDLFQEIRLFCIELTA